MSVWKKIISWFKDPPWYFLLPVMLIAIAATAGGTVILVQEDLFEYKILGFVLLGVAGVTLAYSVYGVVRAYPKAKNSILKWSEGHPRVNKAFNEYGFTTLIATEGSIFITLAFAVYNGSIAIVIRSIWFGALAAYYIVLIILRVSILVYYGVRKRAVDKGQSETKTQIRDGRLFRACGVLLLLLPVALSFAIMQMVAAGDSFEHKGITIYVYAVYAFYKIITAIYSFVKERRNRSMVIMSIKNVKLADAFVSILALQTAMFREFGDPSGNLDIVTMNAITGAIVCALTVAIGVYMIVYASRQIRNLKRIQTIQPQGEPDDEQSENNGTQNDA